MRQFLVPIAMLCFGAALAHGHGVQIQATFNTATQRIETREVVHTTSRPGSITDLKRVYVMPLLDQAGGAGDGWYTRPDDERNSFGIPLYPTGPGVCFQYDAVDQLPGSGWSYSGSSTLPNLQGTNFAFQIRDGLKEWNGSSFVDPGLEQLQAFRGDGTSVPTITAATSDSGPFGALAMSTISSRSSNAHSSVGYRLLGDGANHALTGPGAGDDSVYLASFSLASTALGVNPSDTFYFVMYKNADLADALAAVDHLGFDSPYVQVLPEPSALALLLIGVSFAGGALRRDR